MTMLGAERNLGCEHGRIAGIVVTDTFVDEAWRTVVRRRSYQTLSGARNVTFQSEANLVFSWPRYFHNTVIKGHKVYNPKTHRQTAKITLNSDTPPQKSKA